MPPAAPGTGAAGPGRGQQPYAAGGTSGQAQGVPDATVAHGRRGAPRHGGGGGATDDVSATRAFAMGPIPAVAGAGAGGAGTSSVTAAAAPEAGGGRAARRRGAAAAGTRSGGRRRAPRKAGPGTQVAGLMGELFVTFGVVMLLFVAYQLWWSNVRADGITHSITHRLEHQWNQEAKSGAQKPTRKQDTTVGADFKPGADFALLFIPKLDLQVPIAQGVDKTKVLDKGLVGHYDTPPLSSAMPGDTTGNFAVAGHRNTHGEPFRHLPDLQPGDKVLVETGSTWYTYTVTSKLPQTSPNNVSVIRPIPPGSGFTKPGRYITMTTCTPDFSSTYRYIVWGKQTAVHPRTKGYTPPELKQG